MMSLEDKLAKLDELRLQRKEIDDEILALFGMGEKEKEPEKRTYKKTPRGIPGRTVKPCCGSTGSRHFKTCPLANGGSKPFAPEKKATGERTLMERSDYDALRAAMQDKEFQSAQYALVHKIAPTEVNRAVVSRDYEEYVRGF